MQQKPKQPPTNKICNHYGIGSALAEPILLTGGLIHTMWRLDTTQGSFAVRRLSIENIALLDRTVMPIRQAEQLAQHMQQKINTRVALQVQESYQFIDGDHWMVFPWVTGSIIDGNAITAQHAQSVGKCLANIHRHSISMPNLPHSPWFSFTEQHWQKLLHSATELNLPWAEHRDTTLPLLLAISAAATEAKPFLTSNMIVSHRDLSPTNIIWHEQKLTVIDWEYSGLIHPELELYNTAMIWGINKQGQIDQQLFDAVVTGYGKHFTLDQTVLHAGFLGYLLEWCEFNMCRALRNDDEVDIANTEVIGTINNLAHLQHQ